MQDWVIPLDGRRVPTRDEVGGKGHSIAWMRRLGLRVPEAFVLPTARYRTHRDHGGNLPAQVWQAVYQGIADLEKASGRAFGAGPAPLLVSVRSGAAHSMPGMMDTVLNLGMNDETERALAAETGNASFARDTHRRFVESYAKSVLGVELDSAHGADPVVLRKAAETAGGSRVPDDVFEQLRSAIGAVFSSWESPRAKAYREHRGISAEGGTAVTVQVMVFGNFDRHSGTGVFFTRDPATGEPTPYGDFLPGGQGEDVVSGTVDPLHLDAMRMQLPQVYDELVAIGGLLEREARDVQDIEFTVERGRLYVLQTRNAKRSPPATIRFAVDLATDGLITRQEALARVGADSVEAVLKALIDPAALQDAQLLAAGEPACPGIASGLAVGDADDALELADDGTLVILVRRATSPEDVHGMIAAEGVCTEVGGKTSHAAVVSRELGRPAIVGCGDGFLDRVAGQTITMDGDTGRIYAGALPSTLPQVEDIPALQTLVRWAAELPGVLSSDHPLTAAARECHDADLVGRAG